jgi:hypothetical protein
MKSLEEKILDCASDKGRCAMKVYRAKGFYCPYCLVRSDGTPSSDCAYLGKIKVLDAGVGRHEFFKTFYECEARKNG